jgi:uncharacterized membrane protein YesL
MKEMSGILVVVGMAVFYHIGGMTLGFTPSRAALLQIARRAVSGGHMAHDAHVRPLRT